MEPKIKTSFIPDKMPQQATPRKTADVPGGGGADILVVIAVAVFLVSIAFAAGAFLYAQYQETSLTHVRKSLESERKVLNPATIQFLSRFDRRLKVASEVLANHTAPTVVFDILEALTLKSVYYKNFEYALDPQGNAVISMRGAAKTVNGVARQAEVFGESQAIINPIFSNLNITDEGVEFDIKAMIDKKVLLYTQLVAAEMAGNLPPDQMAAPTTVEYAQPPAAPQQPPQAPRQPPRAPRPDNQEVPSL